MNLFRWSREHDVFLPELNAEHRAIFLAGQEVERVLAAGAPPERLKEAVHNLVELGEAHFRHEERLMRDSRFESLEWHHKQHDTLRKRMKRVDAGDPAAVTAALEYVAGWLRDHTRVADRIMAAHIRNWTRLRAA